MTRNTVIYYDGGDTYKGQYQLGHKDRLQWHRKAGEEGQTGYLSGYRYFDNRTDGVLVYFVTKPPEDEIDKRRRNGLHAAKWYWL
jgi:hypothetical protein